MTVIQLIKKLKKMPQNLQVGVSAHDNSEWEIAGWVSDIRLFDKLTNSPSIKLQDDDINCFDSLPDQAIILTC